MPIKNKIKNELIDLNLNIDRNYFDYWLELLIADYYGKFKDNKTMSKYSYIAKKFDTNIEAVERELRYGKRRMENRIIEKYNVKTKITNEAIVLLFELMIFKEE